MKYLLLIIPFMVAFTLTLIFSKPREDLNLLSDLYLACGGIHEGNLRVVLDPENILPKSTSSLIYLKDPIPDDADWECAGYLNFDGFNISTVVNVDRINNILYLYPALDPETDVRSLSMLLKGDLSVPKTVEDPTILDIPYGYSDERYLLQQCEAIEHCDGDLDCVLAETINDGVNAGLFTVDTGSAQ